jgi:integrase
MPARMEKTRHPGIYRRGSRYVVVVKVDGRQDWEAARTLDAARRLKAAKLADRDRGELREQSRLRFRDYAEEWIERYQGNGRRGFTDDTREDYRRDLDRYAFPFFDARLNRTLSAITPSDAAKWIGWLCDEQEQRRRLAGERGVPIGKVKTGRLADATVRRITAPVRSCLASARREGLIRHNPMDGAVLPNRPTIEEDDADDSRAFTREQLDAVLRVAHPEHVTMFRVLAASGVRWGEVAALRWRDLELEGSPRLKVRRALSRRRTKDAPATFKPPKSKYGRRDLPLDASLARELRKRRDSARFAAADDLVFPARNGSPLRQENVRRRILKPAVEEAGAGWAGFHTFRHTCASMLFERGANAVQVQRWLGHHSPAFTLEKYVHLLDSGVGEALDLAAELDQSANRVLTRATGINRTPPESALAETAD